MANYVASRLIELPWWLTIGLAAAAYPLLGWAPRGVDLLVVASTGDGMVDDHFTWMAYQMARAVLPILQIIVPVLLGAAGVVAIARRLRRTWLFMSALERGTGRIRQMSWQEFEMLVGEAYWRLGYRVQETGLGGEDGGIDLILISEHGKTLVQAKHWKARQVGVGPAREPFGVMASEGAHGGVLVTSGAFTRAARAFAQGKPLELLDGKALLTLIQSAGLKA